MFYNCKSLKSLPDISKWKTINYIEIEDIFEGCSSLESLPDISNWNIKKVKKIETKRKIRKKKY